MASGLYFTYEGVQLNLDKHWARIKNDKNLSNYLSKWGHGTGPMVEEILSRYKLHFGQKLNVGEDSMVVEILAHYHCDSILALGEMVFSQAGIPGSIITVLFSEARKIAASHLNWIDCGEADVDTNRDVWDKLAKFRSIFETILVD